MAPQLAHVNPQPQLPGSKASAPQQPAEFVRRARSLRLGSYRLKVAYLALCRLARTWVREHGVLQISIKQETLAGELECKRDTLVGLLRDLKLTPYVRVLRAQHESLITLFVEPQPPEDPPVDDAAQPVQLSVEEVFGGAVRVPLAAAGGAAATLPDAPSSGVSPPPPVAPQNGATGDPKSDVSVAPQDGATGDPNPGSVAPQDGATGALARTARTGTSGSGSGKQQQYPLNPPTPKQMSGIASMSAELDRPVPEVPDRLAADALFRELRAEVEARRAASRRSARPHRVHRLDRYGQRCEVCKLSRPDPSKPCPGPPVR